MTKFARWFVALPSVGLYAALIALAASNPANAQEAYPPGTFQLTPEVELDLQEVPVIVPEEFSHLPDDLSLNLPPGFSARVFADFDFVQPRFMAFDDEGVLHLSDMRAEQIVALPDRDGDGVADEKIVVAQNFDRAHSLAFYQGDMFVGDRGRIVRFSDNDGDGVYEERSDFARNIPSSGSHSTRTIVIDEINQKVYLSVGWPCDFCPVSDPERGSILEFNIDGSGRRVFASGVRNVVGMDLHPVTNELWGTNNGHDREGTVAPPEWIDVLRDGGFYGIPLAYGYQVFADFSVPQYQEHLPLSQEDSLLVQSMRRPAALVPAHMAPMGIHFYTHEQFPPRYHTAAFVALHAGHAKLAPAPGYKVVALFSEPDGSNARVADFITGFQTGTEMADVWGYPMGVISDAQGHLYVTSDREHKVVLRIEHSPIIASWEHNLPDSVHSGAAMDLQAVVRVERLAADGGAVELTADLSALGGGAEVPLEDIGGGDYRLSAPVNVDAPRGLRTISVRVGQPALPAFQQVRLPATAMVLPASPMPDLTIFDERLADNWRVENKTWLEDWRLDLEEEDVVYKGSRAAAFPVQDGDWDWVTKFLANEPVDPSGYDKLRFAFHPGDLVAAKQARSMISVYTTGTLIDLVDAGLVDLDAAQWQVVELPLAAFNADEPIREITFSGNFGGRYYVDDLRLVDAPSVPTVLEEVTSALPSSFALEQNYPNPFNSDTVIRFALPERGEVQLGVYNLVGQLVVELVRGVREAGSYRVDWDGRDAGGRGLASGVYLYRLRAGERVETRKLVLVR